MKEHSYTEDEVREILRRAVERDTAQATHLDRERLIQAAAEIGIDRVTVDHAIEDVERERDVERELLSLRRERKHELISSVGTWGIVNSGLLAIDVATGEGLWFYWPLTIWAMVLLLVYKGVFITNEHKDREKAVKRAVKRRREEERRRARERRTATGHKLEDVVERGVELLLAAAQRGLDGIHQRRPEHAPPPPPPPPPPPAPAAGRTRFDAAQPPSAADEEEPLEQHDAQRRTRQH